MFRCTEIKLCLGRSIMLFKRYNILSIWLRACTMLSSSLLFLSLSFFYTYNIIFFPSLTLTHTPRVCVQIHKLPSLYGTTFVAMSYCSQIVCDKSACLKQEPSRTMFYPKKTSPVMTNTLTHCCAHIATQQKDA